MINLRIEVALFGFHHQRLQLLLAESQAGSSLVSFTPTSEEGLNLEEIVRKGLETLVQVPVRYLEQIQTIGRAASELAVLYYALVSHPIRLPEGYGWAPVGELCAFSLSEVQEQGIKMCLHRFQNKSLYTSVPIYLLQETFTLTELQRVYEAVLGFKVEKKSFRRRLLGAKVIKGTGRSQRASHRPAQLYVLQDPWQPYFFARMIEGIRGAASYTGASMDKTV